MTRNENRMLQKRKKANEDKQNDSSTIAFVQIARAVYMSLRFFLIGFHPLSFTVICVRYCFVCTRKKNKIAISDLCSLLW